MKEYRFDINPCPAPRMTASDKWNHRPAVKKYFAYRNELKYLCYINNIESIPSVWDSIIFEIPMPKSWSRKSKKEKNGKPHTQRPDLDNLLKGFLDGLCKEDNYVHTIRKLSKVWGETGSICFSFKSPEPAKIQYQQCTIYGQLNQ